MKKSTHLVLATALLALIVMPIAFAGAAGSPQASVNANLKKQIKVLKQRLTALEGKQSPTTLPPNGPAGGDLTGTFPNPTIKADAVGAAELAENSVTSTKILDGAVGAPELSVDSVGSFVLRGENAVVGTGVAITAGTPKEATVTCPPGQMVIGGGYAWTDKEANSIIASAPSETDPNKTWVVEAMVDAGSNTLFAWANCLAI